MSRTARGFLTVRELLSKFADSGGFDVIEESLPYFRAASRAVTQPRTR
jgi:hypothetical protein